MNMIDRLKANEKPFGLMDKDMQEAAEEIGPEYFEVYITNLSDECRWRTEGVHGKGFDSSCQKAQTYRLRPDYEPEPSIVECKIYELGEKGSLCFHRKGDKPWNISNAINYPDFIGFNYQDDTVSGFSKMYRGKSGGASFNAVPFENLDRYKVLHATHVLFEVAK